MCGGRLHLSDVTFPVPGIRDWSLVLEWYRSFLLDQRTREHRVSHATLSTDVRMSISWHVYEMVNFLRKLILIRCVVFTIYFIHIREHTRELPGVASRYNIHVHSYADDTQLFLTNFMIQVLLL